MGAFLKRLDHQNLVLQGVKALKSGAGLIQLVTQNKDDVTTGFGLHTFHYA